MDEKVKKYFQEVKNNELIKRGLVNKHYFSSKELTKDIKNEVEFDEEKEKYYEIIPCDVTDEEFAEILKIPFSNHNNETSLPALFNIISAIFFLGGLLGGILLSTPRTFLDDFNWQLAFTIWFSAFISGMIFIGLGKIIKLLNELNNK
ncbi:MAG: hypothetical protein NTZ74_08930 [Chloroflexi bacterium]|nr:hypothetical protein [Chloroflexota bacterium]